MNTVETNVVRMTGSSLEKVVRQTPIQATPPKATERSPFSEARLIDDNFVDSYEGTHDHEHSHQDEALCELMKPIRIFLDDPRVTELVINRPGELCVETNKGWLNIPCREMSYAQCLGLATAIATHTNQSISEANPLLSATLRRTKERVQIVIPPAVEENAISYTFRKPSTQIYTLEDFEKQGLFRQATQVHARQEMESLLATNPTVKQHGVKLWVDDPRDVQEHKALLEPFEVILLNQL